MQKLQGRIFEKNKGEKPMKEKFMFSNEVRKDLLFHIDTSDNYDSIANRMLDEARLAIERASMDKARELAEKIYLKLPVCYHRIIPCDCTEGSIRQVAISKIMEALSEMTNESEVGK